MIKSKRRVDVIDVVQKVEEIQIIFLRDSLAVVSEPLLDTLDLLDLLLLRISGISEQKLREVGFRNVAVFVRIFAHEFECQNLSLQLMLEVQELFNLQLLVKLRSKEVAAECGVDAL